VRLPDAPVPDITAWLKAIQAAGIKDASGADRLAWAAYLAGNFAGAAAWLDRAPEQTAMRI